MNIFFLLAGLPLAVIYHEIYYLIILLVFVMLVDSILQLHEPLHNGDPYEQFHWLLPQHFLQSNLLICLLNQLKLFLCRACSSSPRRQYRVNISARRFQPSLPPTFLAFAQKLGRYSVGGPCLLHGGVKVCQSPFRVCNRSA